MQHKPLSELPLIAMLRSDRVLALCLEQLQSKDSLAARRSDKFKQAISETLFDMRPHQFRWDDIDKVIDSAWQPRVGGYDLQALDNIADLYLEFKGNHAAVSSNDCVEYQALINQVHPAFLIAAKTVSQIKSRFFTIKALPALLAVQCPLGFSRNNKQKEYADNHVHFGGVHGAEVLTRLLFDPIDRQYLKSMKLPRVPEFTLVNSDNLSATKLISVYRLLFASFCQLSFQQPEIQKQTLAKLPEKVAAALSNSPLHFDGSSLYSKFRINKYGSKTPEQYALFEMISQIQQGHHQQAMIAMACGILLTLKQQTLDPRMVSLCLALIHLVNILRAYVVMSGVGLTQFVGFFASSIRSFNNSSGDKQALRWLMADGNKAALKTSPPEDNFDWFAQTAGEVAKLKQSPDTLDEHFHYCLHYVRDFFGGLTAEMESQKRIEVQQQTHQLVMLLRSQLKHHLNTGQERLKGLRQNKTLWVPSLVRGFDVAGNENHFPIHIFAPALRYLRDKPMVIKHLNGRETLSEQRHLSIHAGEDFSHIVSGLRHIDETVTYCNMRNQDRIGHALALGMCPFRWAQRQKQAFVGVETDLWNTLWLYHYAVELSVNHPEAAKMVAPLRRRLKRLQKHLFNHIFETQHLWAYWQCRGNSDSHEKRMGQNSGFNDRQFWIRFDAGKNDQEHFAKISLALKHAKAQFKGQTITCYLHPDPVHHCEHSDAQNVMTKDIDHAELTFYQLLQDHLMMRYDYKGIVLEVCPSSNISLARFRDYHEHPVFRWFPPDDSLYERCEWDKFGIRNKGEVAVCINTDDPGIFPTKIEQEYHLLANACKQHFGLSSQVTEQWIERLRQLSLRCFSG